MSLVINEPIPEALEAWARTAPITTLPQLFRETVSKVGSKPYLGQKVHGTYRFQTYLEIQGLVHQFAAACLELGFEAGDRVATFSNNRPEWVIADLGAFHCGGIHVPLYATLSAHDAAFILQDSGARLVVSATAEHTRKLLEVAGSCPKLEHIVALEPVDAQAEHVRLWTWSELLASGQQRLAARQAEMEARIAALRFSDVASLVYTSGTTGNPKGAMLMHGNFVSNATLAAASIQASPADVELSFLPLSHVFERLAYYAMTHAGASIGYAESVETVRDNLQELRPTIVPSVPRVFEKIQARVLDNAAAAGKEGIMRKALGVGRAVREARRRGGVPFLLGLMHKLADKLVFSKIKAATGGNVRFFISGGAPLRKDVGDFFLDAGFVILEGYGLTETSPIITMNPPREPRIGTVGQVIPHCEVRIAEDGEIMARGANIMRGYFNRPEATAEAIEPDGWFHTGDIGRFDPDGYLVITDRKKELLVMSNGKNVAPQPLEQAIKGSPWIEMAVVLGDNRNFIGALIVPAFEKLEAWARAKGLPSDRAALVDHPEVVALLKAEVDRQVQEFSGYEQPKKIAVLPRELTMDDGEMTPTLKVKRRVVDQHFAAQIAEVYAGSH